MHEKYNLDVSHTLIMRKEGKHTTDPVSKVHANSKRKRWFASKAFACQSM